MSTLPPLPAPPRTGWWQRHWKWAVPVLCTVLLTLFAGFVLLLFSAVYGMIKSSGPYTEALQRAQANPAAVAALGTPLRDGWFTQGNVRVDGASGEANLQIPVSGPKGKGKLFVEASKSAGQWSFETLVLQVDADGERIDLQGGQAAAPAP